MTDVLTLSYFREIARHEHVGRAAAALHVAQPSLSRSLARLEGELGLQLFDRVGRGLRLNDFGRLYLGRVEVALRALDEGRREVREAAGTERGRVRVAAETLLTLTGVAGGFRRAHPDCDLTLRQATGTEMERLLAEGEVDLCMASVPLRGSGLVEHEVLREPVLLAVPLDHPLAARERVAVREVLHEPFVTQRPGHWPRLLLERLTAPLGQEPVLSCESDEPGVTLDLVAAGLGVALAPRMAQSAEGWRPPVAWVEITDPGCERVLTAVWRHDAFRSSAVATFMTHVARLRHPRRRD